MSNHVLDQKVLVLNKHWSPINFISLERAVNRMNSSKNPYSAVQLDYAQKEDGSYDFSYDLNGFKAVPWEEWIKLSPRPHDNLSLGTSSRNIRIPTVIITHNFERIEKGKQRAKATIDNLLKFYDNTDFWSGKKLEKSHASKDHYISKDEWKRLGLPGSYDIWFNLVPTHRDINSLKGSMNPKEFIKKYPKYKEHYQRMKTAPEVIREVKLFWDGMNPDFRHFIFS